MKDSVRELCKKILNKSVADIHLACHLLLNLKESDMKIVGLVRCGRDIRQVPFRSCKNCAAGS